MTANFTGHWLVSEYVYNPDGTFVGIVRQQRMLEPQGNGRIRVIQQCEPQAELAQHAMGAFKGEWVFDLVVDGRARRYLGPDVLGIGLAWGGEVITGRGVWTRFGHNFQSFSVMVTPALQITGGKFYNASEMVANIIGVAVPERADSPAQYADFTGMQHPRDVARHWHGSSHRFNADGTPRQQSTVQRTYHGLGWDDEYLETGEETKVQLRAREARELVSGTQMGIAKRSGWLLEMEMVHESGVLIDSVQILENFTDCLIGLRRVWEDGALSSVEVLRLYPEK
jgi:hypothetical protein